MRFPPEIGKSGSLRGVAISASLRMVLRNPTVSSSATSSSAHAWSDCSRYQGSLRPRPPSPDFSRQLLPGAPVWSDASRAELRSREGWGAECGNRQSSPYRRKIWVPAGVSSHEHPALARRVKRNQISMRARWRQAADPAGVSRGARWARQTTSILASAGGSRGVHAVALCILIRPRQEVSAAAGGEAAEAFR